MKTILLVISSAVIFSTIFGTAAWAGNSSVALALNGITLPEGYKNWRVISVSHRTDNNTMRAIVGNDKAIEAARKG